MSNMYYKFKILEAETNVKSITTVMTTLTDKMMYIICMASYIHLCIFFYCFHIWTKLLRRQGLNEVVYMCYNVCIFVHVCVCALSVLDSIYVC